MITITCICGKTFDVEDRFAGKRVKCPSCGSVRNVPVPILDALSGLAPQTALPPTNPNPSAPWDELTRLFHEQTWHTRGVKHRLTWIIVLLIILLLRSCDGFPVYVRYGPVPVTLKAPSD